ncbi:hypothetical protein SB724_20080, partial [Bacillus sp. SIMBA_031]|uniref:hypothetical protein n=1 Tax=Bacillus sp. SIMBA_031 TaxID=3085774 RepID=UPI0039788368
MVLANEGTNHTRALPRDLPSATEFIPRQSNPTTVLSPAGSPSRHAGLGSLAEIDADKDLRPPGKRQLKRLER